MGKWHLCTLKPLGNYFFGGEHIFDLYGEDKSYFIRSERMPNQSTLLGMLRFLILSKAGLLNDSGNMQRTSGVITERQKALIGEQGFIIENPLKAIVDYGKIKSLSPVFLIDCENSRWIKTPLNHVKGEKCYTGMPVKGEVNTDLNRKTLLPIKYSAKNGLTDSYMDIDDEGHPVRECNDPSCDMKNRPLFSYLDYTRISRNSDKEGYFKKAYVNLNPDYRIAFYCETETNDNLPEREIVYIGQDKSAFLFSKEQTYDVNPVVEWKLKIGNVVQVSEADVYYAASDIYLPNGINDEHLLFSIVESKSFRTLTQNLHGGKDYRSSRIRSSEFQLIQAGSVFYIEREKSGGLIQDAQLKRMKQVGFNYLVKMGEQ